jgi:cytidylate kinase
MTVLAIDGPAGAGKSTTARAVARVLGWDYVDTGAMYRGLAWAALSRGVDPHDGNALGDLAASLRVRPAGDRIVVDGHDVTERIRGPEVTAAVPAVSSHPRVRAVMSGLQRRLAAGRDVVMEGRDIGTAVFPNAEVKVYLTASLAVRARRRARQLGRAEDAGTLADLESSLESRDANDSSRSSAPLAIPEKALVIDSTQLEIAAVVEAIVAEVRRALGGG